MPLNVNNEAINLRMYSEMAERNTSTNTKTRKRKLSKTSST